MAHERPHLQNIRNEDCINHNDIDCNQKWNGYSTFRHTKETNLQLVFFQTELIVSLNIQAIVSPVKLVRASNWIITGSNSLIASYFPEFSFIKASSSANS